MKKIVLALFIPALFVLGGCQKTANDKQPEVVTSFYPMYAFTKAVVGDKVEVKTIMPSNQEVHEFEPSAKEVATMSKAKVIVYNDNDLEKWASGVNNKGVKIEAAKNVKINASDPHTWLSPKEAIIEVNTIAKGLEKEFPQYKTTFAKNKASYVKKLEALSAQYENSLKNVKHKIIITQHDAFSYLANDYGLTNDPIAGIDPEVEPSSATLIKLKNEMQKYDVKYVYSEMNSNSKVADTLAKATGAKLVELNTLESVSNKQIADGENYINIMQKNLKVLESTLNN
ncbi:metal ABC transporter solute-binding protein, Zn/Mn family [Lactococcus nasutitermitis]|uniref:Metal ABC transporter solute-binding protein, Zn/Mn family n=1 Tax=Lactococcus nasutitermitis TaxID=1652957 RepID=A0ABV9JDZ5_9LACT|nr:zinc ABC transporter substrate-binding protein [Lactococcus nasutitermitis]